MMRVACLILALACAASAASASDKDELGVLLDEFLANAGERGAHERFWGEDLVYTSSAGARFGKADILAGMEDEPASDAEDTAPVYSAEDVDIRLYDDIAIVAFRLVATAADGGEVHYFITGTFAQRDGRWVAVAWQATRIPQTDD